MDFLGFNRSLSCLLVCGLAVVSLANEDVAQNEVWPSSPNVKSKLVSFSSLIQALYRLNTLGRPEEVEVDVEDHISEESDVDVIQQPYDVTDPDDDYGLLSSAAPHLVEEVPDVLPLPIEVDKSNKFTHSFRFGYGVPV